MGILTLDYPITRTYRQPWLGLASYGGAFIAIVLLAVLNAALVGYETITVFQSDPNVVQKFWYDHFMPYRVPKPGSLCASHVFNVGDTFTTDNTIFAWSLQSIEKASAGASGVTYNGSVLNNCDVNGVYLTGDLRMWTVDYSILISCRSGGGVFDVSATTSFSISSLPGKLAPLLGYQRAVNAQTDAVNSRAVILDRVIRSATEDLGERAFVAFSTNHSNPVAFSIQANFEFCPASSTSGCAKSVPGFNITSVASVSSSGELVQNSNNEDGIPILGNLFEAPVFNILQTIYAAARLDLGIDSPNNYLLHKAVMNKTLNATFPVTPSTPANPDNKGLVSHLYNIWENPNALDSNNDYSWMSKFLPLNVTGPASLQVVYLCQFQSLKSPGSLVVSVLVATMSMFSTGWGLYMVFLGMVAKRGSDANHCEGHLNDTDAPQGYFQGMANDSDPKYTMPVPMKG